MKASFKYVRIIAMAVMIIICFTISSCNANFGTAQGKDAVPLSEPTNVRVDGTTLKWNFVENAIGYTVKIMNGVGLDINNGVGEEIPIDGMSTTSYSLAHLASGDYTIGVKARGDSIVYSSSAYAGIQYHRDIDIGDEYGDNEIRRPFGEFDDINTKNSFLGYGLDIINASSISSKNILMTYPIFDMDLLEQEMLLYSNDHYNSFEAIEGETIETFVENMGKSSSISSGSSVSAKGKINGIKAGASVSMSGGLSAAFTKTSSAVQSQYFLEIIAENQSYWLILQSSEDRYKEMLSDEFKKDLYGDMEPAQLFEKYGTHLLTSVAMGGNISMYYTLYSYDATEMTTEYAKIASEIKENVNAAYGRQSVSADSNQSFESAFTYSALASQYGVLIDERIFCAGGGSYGINNATTLYDNYYDWQDSLDLYPVVIGIKDANSLYPIWDLLDMSIEGAEERYNELYAYFLDYGIDSLNELYETYDIAPAVVPEGITNIKLNGEKYEEGSIPQTKAGATVKITFDAIPEGANKYKKLYTVYSDKDTTDFKAATIDESGIMTVSPSVKSGTYITVTIMAGPVSEQITFYTINSYNVNFNTRVNGLEVAPVVGVIEGYSIAEPAISREGWILDGWFTDAEMTDRFDFEVDCIHGHTTLYAKWTAIKPVVTFDTLGGSETDSATVAYNEIVAKPKDPTKTGYVFGGWYTDDDFTVEYDFATTLIDNITLYAKWNKIEYTVSFVSNGGTPVASITTSIESGYKITEPHTDRALYDFKGWFTDEEFTNKFYFGSEITADTTLYAKWEIHYFKVTYFVDGETYGTTQNYSFGETINYLEWPVISGKEFSGWIWTGGELPETMPAEDIILEGSFDQVVFTVKYFVDNIHIDTESVYKGHTIPENESLKVKTGYTFSGWFIKSGDSLAVKPDVMPNTDIELYGTFNVNIHTITFSGCDILRITAAYGSVITAPASPTRVGYSFAGWDREIPVTMPDEDITITAKWNNNSYFVYYDLNNSGLKGTFSASGIVNQATYKATSIINTATSSYAKYYNFDGWYTAKTGGVKVALSNGQLIKSVSGYTDSDGKWVYTENITLYARWSQTYSGYTYIDTPAELQKISSNGKYVIIKDLDMDGMQWTPIDSFSGVLNGDGHCIYNFYISESGSGSANIGLIITNSGTIMNLVIGKDGVKTYDSTYSVKYNISYSESGNESVLYVGGFTANNCGIISSCKLINTYINVSFADKNNNKLLLLDVGGISSGNRDGATIRDCSVEKSYIVAKATASQNSGDDNYVWLGGICAANWGNLKNSVVRNSTLNMEVRGDGKLGNKAYPVGYLGGIVGENASGTTSGCTVSGNTFEHYLSEGGYTHNTLHKDDICGEKSGGSVI